MDKEIINNWEAVKDGVRGYIATHPQSDYDSYNKLLVIILKKINSVRDGLEQLSLNDITVIDYGDYQGTQIFVFHNNSYQPGLGQTYFTSVYYGSCSGCDTLLGISHYDEGLPNTQQVNDYMSLCLHLVQNIHKFSKD